MDRSGQAHGLIRTVHHLLRARRARHRGKHADRWQGLAWSLVGVTFAAAPGVGAPLLLDARGRLRWRDGHALPPASLRFDSPYDTDAHYCVKRDTAWSGYRAHFTETCTSDLPEVAVHVVTTIAPVQDGELTDQIHDDLAASGLAPGKHVVDAAYVTAQRIERAQRLHQITLLGPVAPDPSQNGLTGTLTPKQVEDSITLVLETNPSLLDEETLAEIWNQILGGIRVERAPSIEKRNGKKALRLTDGEMRPSRRSAENPTQRSPGTAVSDPGEPSEGCRVSRLTVLAVVREPAQAAPTQPVAPGRRPKGITKSARVAASVS